MSKYAMLASLIAAAQTAIFVACHVALINSDQADNSGVVSEACLVLQHIFECHSWWGREWWRYHRSSHWWFTIVNGSWVQELPEYTRDKLFVQQFRCHSGGRQRCHAVDLRHLLQ
ncbi:TPA: hypothetical protein ACH3X1_007324 [Trebouxia sp. C0004]